MHDERNGGRNRVNGHGAPVLPGLRPAGSELKHEMDAVPLAPEERVFLLASAAHPEEAAGPGEMQLLIYTAARNGEVLLKVRCFGDSSSLA